MQNHIDMHTHTDRQTDRQTDIARASIAMVRGDTSPKMFVLTLIICFLPDSIAHALLRCDIAVSNILQHLIHLSCGRLLLFMVALCNRADHYIFML